MVRLRGLEYSRDSTAISTSPSLSINSYMKNYWRLLMLGDVTLGFWLDKENKPKVDACNSSYHSLYQLCQALPDLLNSDASTLAVFAQVATFLQTGCAYECIKNIEKFRHDYETCLRQESEQICHSSIEPLSPLTQCSKFDLSCLKHPHLSRGELIFFVTEDCTSLPYRASILYPPSENAMISYHLLPYASL